MSLKKKESSRREKMKSLEAIMKNTKREPTERAPWTAEEDQKLAEVVAVHGAENWTSSAHNDYMGGATTPGVIVNSISISDDMNSLESTMKNAERKPSRRSPWTAEEDQKLVEAIAVHGAKSWGSVAANAGLQRNGKSCRLRWLNYLRPEIKRGKMSDEEEDLIIRLHKLLGNRWSLIAGRLPGRTDNDIKNYWNSRSSKRIRLKEKQSSTGGADDPTRQVSTVDQKPSILLPDQINVHIKMKEYSSAEALTTTAATTTSGSNKGASDDHHDRSNSDIDVDDFFDFCNEGPFKLE